MIYSFEFLFLRHELPKSKNKWSKIQYKLLKINTLNIFFKFLTQGKKHWAKTKSRRLVTLLSPLCFSRSQNMVFHKRWASPLLTPFIYSSLVRHLPKTYSTKCPMTSPGANNCIFLNQARPQSTTLYTMYTPHPSPWIQHSTPSEQESVETESIRMYWKG